MVGNCIHGLPLGADGDVVRPLRFFELFGSTPVPSACSRSPRSPCTASIYLYLKTEGELQKRIHGWMWTTFGIFLAMYILCTILTMTTNPRSVEKFRDYPWLWAWWCLNVLAIANIPRAIYLNKPFYAFLSSSATIAAFTFLFGMTLYPNMIVSTVDPANNLTLAKAASSEKTLWIMLGVALLGMPFVLTYTATIYWVFRGKVQVGKFSY